MELVGQVGKWVPHIDGNQPHQVWLRTRGEVKMMGVEVGLDSQGRFLEEGAFEMGLLSALPLNSHGTCSLGISLFGFPFLGLFLATLHVTW